MALLSSTLDCGEKDGVVVHTVGDVDPDDPENMAALVAFECTQEAVQNFRPNNVACENM